MSKKQRIDFRRVVEEVQRSQVGQEELSIWGGRVSEADVCDFLKGWKRLGKMPYRIWEYVSEIVFERDSLPNKLALLERGRLFGEGGDLELRRDGQEFTWRFIGPAGVKPPSGDYSMQEYWSNHDGISFYQRDEIALLWGKWNGHRWRDDRVGAARLEYPASAGWQRVQIHYKTFSRAGRVEFVWYTCLSEWKEDDNG